MSARPCYDSWVSNENGKQNKIQLATTHGHSKPPPRKKKTPALGFCTCHAQRLPPGGAGGGWRYYYDNYLRVLVFKMSKINSAGCLFDYSCSFQNQDNITNGGYTGHMMVELRYGRPVRDPSSAHRRALPPCEVATALGRELDVSNGSLQ